MIIVQTPLRLSFLGGGTDFPDFFAANQGAVLTTAIDKYVFVIVRARFDDLVCVNYSERERVEAVSQVRHELVREALLLSGVNKGIEITTLADVPAEGTGLGSSSSVTVGLIHALAIYQHRTVTADYLATEACRIEIDHLRKPIGRQDQLVAAHGGMRYISFNNSHTSVDPLPLDSEVRRKLNDSLLLFYTGVTRKSSDILTEQKAEIPANLPTLKAMAALAGDARLLLSRGKLDDFGALLHQGWELKKKLASKISNPAIDSLYESARRAGALGGKITGAGGGGFLLLYSPVARQDAVRQALGLRELPFRFEADGSKIVFHYRQAS